MLTVSYAPLLDLIVAPCLTTLHASLTPFHSPRYRLRFSRFMIVSSSSCRLRRSPPAGRRRWEWDDEDSTRPSRRSSVPSVLRHATPSVAPAGLPPAGSERE